LSTPKPTQSATQEPATPAPPEPEFEIYNDVVTVGADARVAFRGKFGSYTWSTVSFPEYEAVVRWDVTSTGSACNVNWWADSVSGQIEVGVGQQVKGSERISTPFAGAEIVVDSECDRWLITIQGVAPVPDPTERPPSGGGGNCHPSYEGACLRQDAGDYDCAGGSGNGPNYVAGPISVIGYDEFDLDRDGNGVGCQ
jgi:hypothetical protein